MRLKDKVILVTGSTTGIGEGMATLFARHGARVMVHGIDEKAALAVVEKIRRDGGTCDWVIGPLEDAASPRSIVEKTVRTFGRIDGLVNNAAVMTRSSLESTNVETFDRTIAINLRAPFLLIQAALPHFRRQGGGRVLNIGSMNGYCGEPNQFAYSISKGGLMTLTRNIADVYGAEGVRVNLLNVGWTLTENEFELKKKEGLPEDWPSRVSKTFAPSGRLLSPEDILTLENHYEDNYLQYPEFAQKQAVFVEIVGKIQSPWFGVNYDPSNTILAGEDPLELLDAVKDRVVSMHASDRYLKSGTMEDLRKEEDSVGDASRLAHGVVGKGLNDYDRIFATLRGEEFDSWISIEDGMDGLADLRESVRFLREKIDRHFA